MSHRSKLTNSLKCRREELGWSQARLAAWAGLSRSEVSAIETGRLVPSTVAALGLAHALRCTVEDLFRMGADPSEPEDVSWATGPRGARHWRAEVGGRVRRYGVEPLGCGLMETDESPAAPDLAAATLVLATCDPSVGILARYLDRLGIRCLALTRPSRCALKLLRAGVVHAAGLHLGEDSSENVRFAGDVLGSGYRLLRVTYWEEGVAFAPGHGPGTLNARSLNRMRWIGRQPGSGARQLSDALLGHPKRLPEGYSTFAPDHRAIADTIRLGLAEVGVCVRLAAEERALGFQSVTREAFDLCLREDALADPPVAALIRVVQSTEYRRSLAALPGFDPSPAGEMIHIP